VSDGPAVTDVDLQSPQLFINRELSFLEFNRRVLAQAQDDNVPLLERVKFLAISCTTLDEFFEIRVAGLKQRRELGSLAAGPDGMDVDDQLEAIRRRSVELLDTQYALLNYAILPALEAAGIRVLPPGDWSPEQQEWIAAYFANEVEPVLTPLGLDPARPFPRIQNKSLNFIVRLAGQDAYGRDTGLAIVQAPRSLPRVVALPEADGHKRFVLLTGIVQHFVSRLLPGSIS
jgi:polyphosphate kinase